MERPTGVVILAVLYWLAAFCLVMFGFALAVGLTIFSGMMAGVPTVLAGVGMIGGIVVLGFGAASAFIGYGLFQLQEWARVTSIVIAAIGLLGALYGFFHPVGFARLSALVRMAFDAFIIWYLVQPQIVGSFRRA
jgi:uncharacterized membrane protein (DUF2068 family)